MQLEPEITLGKIGYRRPIGILGGSFNPPHLGHVHISKVSLRMFDLGQIYWVYTKKNPLKNVAPSSFDDRVEETKKLVKSPKIKLSPIEIRHDFQYSFQLLETGRSLSRGGSLNIAADHAKKKKTNVPPNICNLQTRLPKIKKRSRRP